MRISVDKDSPDYSHLAWHATAFLDGKELTGCCVMADDELGECIVHAKDENGKTITVDGTNHGKPVLKTIYGKVEIVLADE